MSLTAWIDFAVYLARESAEVIRPHFANPRLHVEQKADSSPVTEADRASEQRMRELIRRHYPDHGIFGEEYGSENEGAALQWVLDPIDGTKSFVAGTPQFGTLIALLRDEEPLLGVISNPVTGQILTGDSQRALLDGTPVRVRETRALADAVLLTTDLRAPERHQSAAGWRDVRDGAAAVYTWGDCHGYHLLSCGGADIMCDPVMSPWDLYALIPIVRGAGGVITDWQGNDPARGSSIVAAVPQLHGEVISRLNP